MFSIQYSVFSVPLFIAFKISYANVKCNLNGCSNCTLHTQSRIGCRLNNQQLEQFAVKNFKYFAHNCSMFNLCQPDYAQCFRIFLHSSFIQHTTSSSNFFNFILELRVPFTITNCLTTTEEAEFSNC